MRTLTRRVKWAAVALGAGALATWLFPVVATVLTVALYSSWAVIVALLLRAMPVPERVRSGLPAMRGHAQRAAAAVRAAPAPARSWPRAGRRGLRARSLPPGSAWLAPYRWY